MAALDFLENYLKASNPQVYTGAIPEDIDSFARNDVISYFRSAANCAHATAAVIDFTVAK